MIVTVVCLLLLYLTMGIVAYHYTYLLCSLRIEMWYGNQPIESYHYYEVFLSI